MSAPEKTPAASYVTPEFIREQREAGWPDVHPEDYCHRCGRSNMMWCATREDWLAATAKWADETGREGICCPQCFAEMWSEATGQTAIWMLTRHTATASDHSTWYVEEQMDYIQNGSVPFFIWVCGCGEKSGPLSTSYAAERDRLLHRVTIALAGQLGDIV